MTGPRARGHGAPGQGLSVLAALLLLSLAACDSGPATGTEDAVHDPPAGANPQLWRVEAVGETGAPGAPGAMIYACVDDELRKRFLLLSATVNGQHCRDVTAPTQTQRGWVLRCQSHGHWYSMSSAVTGDETDNFRLEFAMTPLYPDIGTTRLVRHFSRMGSCPSGWRIGDQARPGQRPARRRG